MLPKLPYAYNALEPHISGEIMECHHKLDHQGYVDTCNKAVEMMKDCDARGDMVGKASLGCMWKFAIGGHINHCLFWENMCPAKETGKPSVELETAITERFGSMKEMQRAFNNKAGSIHGSGWGWLGYCPCSKELCIKTCCNQDLLEATEGVIPILGCDVWEHAYFTQYKNKRSDYLENFWSIVNWKCVSERYACACKGESNVHQLLCTPIDKPSVLKVTSSCGECKEKGKCFSQLCAESCGSK